MTSGPVETLLVRSAGALGRVANWAECSTAHQLLLLGPGGIAAESRICAVGFNLRLLEPIEIAAVLCRGIRYSG